MQWNVYLEEIFVFSNRLPLCTRTQMSAGCSKEKKTGLMSRLCGCIDFRLDVNGLKNPNKDGSDIFNFTLCPWNSSFYFDNANRKWGTLCGIRNDREALIRSKTCASRILELDNWEFRDDYPWKF
ncbi:MAG: hypothetical protein KIC80_01210 [Brachyspira sp.]|nr:hypothetical protein [Brachyspira sp.]